MKYCPICNTSSNDSEFVGELCLACFMKLRSKKLPGKMNLMVCKRCGRIKTPQGYSNENKNALQAVVEKELKSKNATVKFKRMENEGKEAEVEFKVEAEGRAIVIDKKVEVKILYTICDTCYKKASGYYEAVVQLRGDARSVEKVSEHLERFLEKGGSFVAKREEHAYGVDIYTSDKRATEMFLDRNRITSKKSYTLYSSRNGKNIYRHIYSVQLD